uniref:Uncharacterized protein n=1 Tax=Rhizophora mucronata TaxID=61149 RepID=A0A2P2MRN1_RHIMU
MGKMLARYARIEVEDYKTDNLRRFSIIDGV